MTKDEMEAVVMLIRYLKKHDISKLNSKELVVFLKEINSEIYISK